jgi:hypothetical protein
MVMVTVRRTSASLGAFCSGSNSSRSSSRFHRCAVAQEIYSLVDSPASDGL